MKPYLYTFAALLVLTGVTTAVAFADLGGLNAPIALLIAGTKTVLVMLYFMHLRASSRLTWLFAGTGFFWLAILLALTLSDYLTRPW